ncbi:hypothetical protein TNCT_633731 [Trichonephila clavata]|uniref:Uncharacterized protein n=1 Tax=Trichonephila clavata TaxID=2740835 RepID=A0A8X6LIQ7_TRICU|nr:hypothetical protein TNCT_633731 [Trichonephila clavata]
MKDKPCTENPAPVHRATQRQTSTARRSSPYPLRNILRISKRQAIPGRTCPYITRSREEARQKEEASRNRRSRFRPYKQRSEKGTEKEGFDTEKKWRFVLEQYESFVQAKGLLALKC